MNIALNGQYILTDNPAGPERFTINLYKYLAKVDHKNYFTVYFERTPSAAFVKEVFSDNPNFKIKVIRTKFLWTQVFLALETWKYNYDIFFSARHTFPLLKNFKTKSIVMFHGLEYKTNKEFNRISLLKFWHPYIIKLVAQLADLIIVPSEATQNNIKKEFPNIKANKIKIIHEGVDENFHVRTKNETQPVLSKYELNHKEYLLFISTIQPRKNLPKLIEAFANTLKNHPDVSDINLVVVGKLGWKYAEALNAPTKYKVENRVKFLNWVPQEDIHPLISGALGYTNFSVDEGFGLTVLEAMASEIPVAVSDIPAHKEVGGQTITYADPNNTAKISQNLDAILENKYDAALIEKAKDRSKEFTWENTANKVLSEFSSLISR